ncbi:MAG: hypothetical protein OEM49_07635, partial [Myxococcales bacterium]|nr:hypothetical protein [Myxococcales bacterium]
MQRRFEFARAIGASIGVAAALLAAVPAAAAGYMAMQGGVFGPWQGDVGYTLALQMLGSNAGGKSRWGGEFEYRNFDSSIVDVPGVEVESYIFRGMWQHHFAPDRVVSPYLGLGLGIAIDVVDDHKVDRARGVDTIGSTSAGLDGIFLFGVQAAIPGTDYLSVYGEGRVGFGFSVYGRNDTDRVQSENLGG